MKVLQVQYEMRLTFAAPATDHHFLFRCLPMEDDAQTVEKLKLSVEPACAVHERIDGFGNRMCYGELPGPHDSLHVRMNARVRVERKPLPRRHQNGGVGPAESGRTDAGATAVFGPMSADCAGGRFGVDGRAGEVPVIVYMYPSELTRPDEAMKEWLDAIREEYDPECSFPEYLMHRLYQRLSYAQGLTHVGTTAAEAFGHGRGVCQDYAHIYVALCRMAGFPARYVAGMAVGEGATHAWAEVWQDGAWIACDPTHDCAVDDRYIKLSHGRDFIDCSVDRGCFCGADGQEQTVYVKVTETT